LLTFLLGAQQPLVGQGLLHDCTQTH